MRVRLTLREPFRVVLAAESKIHYHMVVDKLGITFAALSDPTRRLLVKGLSQGPASVHRLTEPFALSQQMISKHIAYLVRARIVRKTKRGRESVCTLRPEAIKAVSDWALDYRRFWEESFDKLDAVLTEMKRAEVKDGYTHSPMGHSGHRPYQSRVDSSLEHFAAQQARCGREP